MTTQTRTAEGVLLFTWRRDQLAAAGEVGPRQALEHPRHRSVRLQPREVHPDAHVRPVRERRVQLRVRAPDVQKSE